jgi:hypothetical protein
VNPNIITRVIYFKIFIYPFSLLKKLQVLKKKNKKTSHSQGGILSLKQV